MSVRKFILAISAVLYILLSVGFSVDWHYCMGELSEIRFQNPHSDICGKCGMKEKKGGCCENETKFYKYQHAYKSVKEINAFATYDLDFESTYFTLFNDQLTRADIFHVDPLPPDDSLTSIPIYKRNRVFRI
jgi:hypothetical protein